MAENVHGHLEIAVFHSNIRGDKRRMDMDEPDSHFGTTRVIICR